jgi:tripartite-type tricarboxylate transporter receptor subunit TctC
MALSRRRFQQAALAAALIPSAKASAQANTATSLGGFPDKIIKVIVPYPAGGVVDIVVRTAVDAASALLPQRVLVENRTGADGRIGLDAVAKSAPDGYTLLGATPLISVGEHLMADMKGRAQDFKGIVAIASPASVFVVPATLDVKTLKDFIALASSKPNELNVANPGSGSSIHLAQELLFDLANIKLTNVNYKGQPPALLDGKLKALAVNAAKRTKSLPDVPTIAEAGFPDALVQAWYGIAAPAKTPQPILNYLIEQFQKVMNLPETKTKLDALDAEILGYNGQKFDALIESEFKRWGELIRKRKIVAASVQGLPNKVSLGIT